MSDQESECPYHHYDFFVKHFLKLRKIYLWGDINSHNSYLVVNALDYLSTKNNDPIYLYINSEGGSVDYAISILDKIEEIKGKNIVVCTTVIGCAYSAASFILMAGTPGYRIATPHSSVMIHAISYSLEYDSVNKNKRFSEFVEKQNELLTNLVAEYCKKNSAAKLKKFKDEIKDDLWLSAKDALKFGLIDSLSDV